MLYILYSQLFINVFTLRREILLKLVFTNIPKISKNQFHFWKTSTKYTNFGIPPLFLLCPYYQYKYISKILTGAP